MTDRLTIETFAPAVGTAFALDAGEPVPGPITMRLADATPGPRRDADGWVPFSLHFVGPPDPVLPQRIYRLAHETVGTHDVFLVPIARDADGTTYEAVFG